MRFGFSGISTSPLSVYTVFIAVLFSSVVVDAHPTIARVVIKRVNSTPTFFKDFMIPSFLVFNTHLSYRILFSRRTLMPIGKDDKN